MRYYVRLTSVIKQNINEHLCFGVLQKTGNKVMINRCYWLDIDWRANHVGLSQVLNFSDLPHRSWGDLLRHVPHRSSAQTYIKCICFSSCANQLVFLTNCSEVSTSCTYMLLFVVDGCYLDSPIFRIYVYTLFTPNQSSLCSLELCANCVQTSWMGYKLPEQARTSRTLKLLKIVWTICVDYR